MPLLKRLKIWHRQFLCVCASGDHSITTTWKDLWSKSWEERVWYCKLLGRYIYLNDHDWLLKKNYACLIDWLNVFCCVLFSFDSFTFVPVCVFVLLALHRLCDASGWPQYGCSSCLCCWPRLLQVRSFVIECILLIFLLFHFWFQWCSICCHMALVLAFMLYIVFLICSCFLSKSCL